MKELIDPNKMAKAYRKKLVNENGEVLCLNFAGTTQASDIKVNTDLIPDVHTGLYTFRSKISLKGLDSKTQDHKTIMDALNDDKNFDIPLWFLRKNNDKLENIMLYDQALIYQLMACNFCTGKKTSGCVQCFVDNESNVPDLKTGVYFSSAVIADNFENFYKRTGIPVLRISGGETSQALDHILAVLQELERRNLPILVQFDTNLSTGRFIKEMEEENVYPKNVLSRIAYFGPGVLVSLKGTSDESVQKNTQTSLTVQNQIDTLKMYVDAKVDVYPYIYNPDTFFLPQFISMLESNFENILPKTHVVITKDSYAPTTERIDAMAEERGVDSQELWQYFHLKWKLNYEWAKNIMNDEMNKRYGMNYKQNERPGIEIRVRR